MTILSPAAAQDAEDPKAKKDKKPADDDVEGGNELKVAIDV